ncbi:Lipoprotein signal peptidase [subsurface metagenome]
MKYQYYVKPRWYFILLMIIFLLGIDQITKYVASQLIKEEVLFGPSGFGLKYITNEKLLVFHLIKVSNPGVVINSVVILIIILCIFLVYRFLKLHFPHHRMFTWAFIFCFGGLFSNLADNILLGHVRDFIVFWKLGICNFADIFYYVGLGLFLLSLTITPQIRRKLNRSSIADLKIFFQFSVDELKKPIALLIRILTKMTKTFKKD